MGLGKSGDNMEYKYLKPTLIQTMKYKSSKSAWVMTIIFLMIFTLNTMYHFQEVSLTAQLFYIPIYIAVMIFGIKAGILTALFAGLSIKSFVLLFASNTAIVHLFWFVQSFMFLAAVVFGIFIKYFNNLKELSKIASHQNIQIKSNNDIRWNHNSILKAIKYSNVSFEIFEYRNLSFINSQTNFISGKQDYELIILDKYNYIYDDLSEQIAG